MRSLFKDQPRAFYVIFLLEIWERFGFYTTQGILTLYLIRSLHLSAVDAYYTFGAFSALVYGLVAFGGFLGDKILGTKRTLLFGLILLSLGYLALALTSNESIYTSLALIAVGNGFFKANPSNLLSKCYPEPDQRVENAFTLYYMAVNTGSLLALIVGPTLSSRYGYSYAYFASFIGILLALANYIFQKKYMDQIPSTADENYIKGYQWFGISIGTVGLVYICSLLMQNPFVTKKVLMSIIVFCLLLYTYYMYREPSAARKRMIVAFILMAEAVVFFTLYQQLPTSLTLFSVHHIRSTFFGITIDPQSFRVLNSLWIVILSPLMVYFYSKMDTNTPRFSIPYKFALGLVFCGIGFGILFFARFFHDSQMMVSPIWVIISYCFQSIGELLVSALGIAMIAKLVPTKIRGFVMGMWFLTSSIAGFTGAFVASLTGIAPSTSSQSVESLEIYTRVFGEIGLAALMIALFLGLIAPKLQKNDDYCTLNRQNFLNERNG